MFPMNPCINDVNKADAKHHSIQYQTRARAKTTQLNSNPIQPTQKRTKR
jgi:hypothetical protein